MAVSLVKKIIRGHPYWYARECQRVDGRPKIIWQKYLGKAELIATALGAPSVPDPPKEVSFGEFGGSAALWDLAQQLDLPATIDRHTRKRNQGVGVGTYITLAALNRCLAPSSKARLAQWYDRTVLKRLCPMEAGQLTSQRFWDHMNYLDAEEIKAIETELTQRLIENFDLDLSCLLYDATNFFTFIDTFNEAPTLAQRGHCKEKRNNLRIVGLSLMVSRDFHIPLFHHVYAGNLNDPVSFGSVTEELISRYQLFQKNVENITLIYDKGNNSQENQAELDESPYHFVGSLSPSQHQDLLEVRRSRFVELKAEDLEGVSVWRTSKVVLGQERTILLVYNPELFQAQVKTLVREMDKRRIKLRQLQNRLKKGSTRGRSITRESAQKQVAQILSGRHMKDLFQTNLSQSRKKLRLTYHVDQAAWRRLQRTLFGINILFTNQDSWSNEEVVRAYRSQYHVEEAFKRMKNPRFVSWRPMHHWTNQKIRVHGFYCVLALLLSSLLRRQLAKKNVELSVVKILENLTQIQEIALVYRGPRSKTKPVITYSKLNAIQKQLIKTLDLKRFQIA